MPDQLVARLRGVRGCVDRDLSAVIALAGSLHTWYVNASINASNSLDIGNEAGRPMCWSLHTSCFRRVPVPAVIPWAFHPSTAVDESLQLRAQAYDWTR